MKKVLSLVLCVVMIFSFVSCTEEKEPFSLSDFGVYYGGEKITGIENSDIGFISFASDFKSVPVETQRGISIGSIRGEVVSAYDGLVHESDIEDRGDRIFYTYLSESGQEYMLRFFFSADSDDSVVTEIDIMNIPE